MANYLEEVDGKYFTDLVQDQDFQKDLVRFFRGSRYGMSNEELKELGPNGLAEKFVEHMRWQDTNEVTALRDYNYVMNKETLPQEELESFGKLMTAYDRAEGGGTGMLSGAADYLSAFATSPSTIATVGTAGWGSGSKLAAKATGKAAQLALRQEISDLVKKGVSKTAIKDAIAGTVGKQALKGGATSFVVEGALGAGQAALQGETREEAAGTEYTSTDLLRDGILAGTIGGTLGSAARAMDTKSQRAVVDSLVVRDSVNTARQQTANKAANETFAAADSETISAAADRAVTIANTLKAKMEKTQLDPLDPKLVEEGNKLKTEVLIGKVDRSVTANLSIDTLRGITAATVKIADTLNVKPNERISSAVARALEEGKVDGQFLEDIRETYNLSKEQLSYVFLADLSQAGKTLAEASYIASKTGRKTAKEAAEAGVSRVSADLEALAGRGLNTLADSEVVSTTAKVYKEKDTAISKAYKLAQDLDATRIAFMTSQVGTTAANTATSVGNLLIDMSDQFWKNTINTAFGRQVGDKVERRWVGGTLSTIKGMSWNKTEASLFREIFLEEMPEEYSRLFYEATRAEVAAESSTFLAKAGRSVNILNSAVDSTFKQAVLYSSVDRSLRELNRADLGTNLGEFLAKNKTLDSLPEDFITRAVDDAKRFTFQRSYSRDKSAFGQAAQGLITAHQKMPFVVSSGLGMPFPRYIANHLEHINDYTPIGIATGGLNKLDGVLFGDTNKTGVDRVSRQLTGASLIVLGAYTAAQKEGEVDYKTIETETGNLDISRTAGPWLFNFYLGDLYYRWKNDLPTGDVLTTMAEISVGTTELGFQAPLVKEIVDSANEGVMTQGLARSLGDIGATFTYPLTLTRDFIGQVNPEMLTTPYTREVFGGSLEEPETYGEGNYLDEVIRRATRFLPEVDFVQYAQSYNKKTAIPYYSPFSATPVGSFDPLSKQFGFAASQRPNEIQKEISRLNLKEFELYGNKTVANPAVDVLVRERLGKSLPQKFEAWKSQVTHGGRFAGKTYDEIEDTGDRTNLFMQFIGEEIAREKEFVEEGYNNFLTSNPKAAAGYIRNMYVLEEKKLISDTKNKEIYDTAVKTFTNGKFGSAADYIGDSASVVEEVERRQAIMSWGKQLDEGFVPLPENKFD
jgi:hypothetical protein